jgi:ribonucleoside-diphosphate reductase alpha chain
MPQRRAGWTKAVTIGGERFSITANGREDGALGEVFIQWGKQGTIGAGLMDAYATALSVGLQHGVPLAELVRQGLDLAFVPNGRTDDPQIPRARSVVDYVARRLAIDWLPYDERGTLGIFTIEERVAQADDWMGAADIRLSSPGPGRVPDTFSWELATGIGDPAIATR